MLSEVTLLSPFESYLLSAPGDSIIFSSSVCKNCDKFDFYEDSMFTNKCPNNCVKWLGNCGECPKDEAIKLWIKDFEQ